MKNVLLIFCALFLMGELIFPVKALNSPNVDEIEEMLKNVEKNMKMASQVVSVAKQKGEKLVESKVEEKAELKEAVVNAEAKIEVMEKKNEVFLQRMVEIGLDTSTVPSEEAKLAGPIYDEWLAYRKNGGESDFEYYRLYKK
jgi:non-ribosomal peptide synthetase component E (peptide arylation enzyme)